MMDLFATIIAYIIVFGLPCLWFIGFLAALFRWFWAPNSWYRQVYFETHDLYKSFFYRPIFLVFNFVELTFEKHKFIRDLRKQHTETWLEELRKSSVTKNEKNRQNIIENRLKRMWKALYAKKIWYVEKLKQDERDEVERRMIFHQQVNKPFNTDVLRRHYIIELVREPRKIRYIPFSKGSIVSRPDRSEYF